MGYAPGIPGPGYPPGIGIAGEELDGGGAGCSEAGAGDEACDAETLDIAISSSWEGITKSREPIPAPPAAFEVEDDGGGVGPDGGEDGGVDDGGVDDGGVDAGGI